MFWINERFCVLEDTVIITVGARSKQWFTEKLGREVRQGDVLEITPDLIPPKSETEITGICPVCGKHRNNTMKIFSRKGGDSCCEKCRTFLESGTIGKKFGSLTVLKLDHIQDESYRRVFWVKCKCDCGEIVVRDYNRLNGESVCNALHRQNEEDKELIGKTFSKLTILNVYRNKKKERIATCLCECGKTKDIPLGTILGGGTKSCGCLKSPYDDVCSVEGCNRPHRSMGFCQKHYSQFYMQTETGKENGKKGNQTRRARKLGVETENFTSKEIFERDGWICQLCGKKVNKCLKWPDAGSPTLDHIIPLSRGGSHTRDNVQLAHRGCNSQKHDKLPEEFLAYQEQGAI